MSKILLVDDEAELVESMARALSGLNSSLEFLTAFDATTALKLAQSGKPEVAVIDLCLESRRGVESGIELLENLVKQDSTIRVIVLTGHSSVDIGVRCLRLGAASFLEKPPNIAHLSALIEDGVSQSNLKRSYKQFALPRQPIFNWLVAQSESMKPVVESIEFAAQTDQAVLLLGETGVGKGHCARAIHELSARHKEHFVCYQACSSTLEMIHADLFGAIKGAFTGSTGDRQGLLRLASNGTFFLDEIDELPLQAQVTMLRIVQTKSFRPLGYDKEIQSEFRLLSASNQDMQKALSSGKLRQDLYHRISQLVISIPPLRNRLADIEPLTRKILQHLSESEHLNVLEASSQAVQKLKTYAWPGNIRELENIVTRGAYRANIAGRNHLSDVDVVIEGNSSGVSQSLFERMEAFREQAIIDALTSCEGNVSAAARLLGVDRQVIRTTLKKSDKNS